MKAPIRIDACTVAHNRSGRSSCRIDTRSPAPSAPVSCRWRRRASQTGLSLTDDRIQGTSSAGTTPTQNITRQPSVEPSASLSGSGRPVNRG